MRLDKYLSELGVLTRSESKKEIKKKLITVNGQVALKPEMAINPELDVVSYKGKTLSYEPFVYYMLHKPQGVVSATEDVEHKTVIDLLREAFPEERREIFPIGRLDLDTEGLLLLTNDGALSHALLSPVKHVEKTYYVEVEGKPSEEALKALEGGLDIGDDKPTKPAKAVLLAENAIQLTITEGRYHQVKRMCAKVGHPVTYLKRISFGRLSLDETLPLGSIRKLTKEEVELLKS